MEKFIWVLCLGAIACRTHEWSRQPAVQVSGWIEGPGAFEMHLPKGYVRGSERSRGTLWRWTRGQSDPSVELDPNPSEAFPPCSRTASDQSVAEELGTQKDTSVCRQSDGTVYVRRMTRGDDPLSCFVVFNTTKNAEGEEVKAGVAICDSLRVDQHVLTFDPHVLSPSLGVHLRVAFDSGASAFADMKIPFGYVVERSPDIFIRHRTNSSLPPIGILIKRTVCDDANPVLKIALEDGSELLFCEFPAVHEILVMRQIVVADGEDLECFIHIDTSGARTASSQIREPLPAAVVEQRRNDAASICKSLKISGYQKTGNPTE